MRGSRRIGAALFLAALLTGCGQTDQGPNATNPSGDRAAAEEYLRAAERLAGEKNLPEAMKAVEQAKRTDPSWGAPYLTAARLYARSAHHREAQAELLAGHRADPKDMELTVVLLVNTQSFFPPAEAERLAREAMAQAPGQPDPPLFLGMAIVRAADPKRYPEALKAFEEAGRLAPGSPLPILEMGKLYSLMGDQARAAALLESANLIMERAESQGMARQTPIEKWAMDRRAVYFWLGQVYQRMGRTAASRTAAAQAEQWNALCREVRHLQARLPDPAARARLKALTAASGKLMQP